eukprot:TRINITY_DN46912_c0_g1_i1.p1 TRINITY_DN46912_c0_g1~~TRINITY_DN46912_c0_g1_i1.p1  ORF type:complete len:446 (-),score=130.66 TRINITY_DN46912_c0_g1_i1:64-1401(-)
MLAHGDDETAAKSETSGGGVGGQGGLPSPSAVSSQSLGDADADPDAAAVAELSNKIVQLTRAIVFLHTRGDGLETRCAALRAVCGEEVRKIATFAASAVERQRAQVSLVAAARRKAMEAHEQGIAAVAEQARLEVQEARAEASERREAANARAEAASARNAAAVAEARHRAETLRTELFAAEARVQSDARWLARHLAAEAAQQRRVMDEEFECASARLRAEHAEETAAMRPLHDAAVSSLRSECEARLQEAAAEASAELAEAVSLQEQNFDVERQALVARGNVLQEELTAARQAAEASRQERANLQRQLDDMSSELQAQKRRAHALSTEADREHERRLKFDSDLRELRRQKNALERSLPAGEGDTDSGAPLAERAIADFAEDVREAQARLEALRGDVAAAQNLLEMRRNVLAEHHRRTEGLAQEFSAERLRSDNLQRVLLRLEQG